MKELREEGSFTAVDDKGHHYTVVQRRWYNENRFLDGTTTWTAHSWDLKLPDGSPVNVIDDNTFEIVETDQIIRRVE